eukprot:g15700.t1
MARGLLMLALAVAVVAVLNVLQTAFVGSSPSRKISSRDQSKVCRFPGDKRLKDRWTSVGKTGKLTDAMRLVAAAKVRAAQAGVEKARPFSDELLSMIKGLVKKLKGSGLEADLPMLRVPDKVNNVGILVITAQRGLCGAYNAFVMKKLKARVGDLNEQGIVPKLFIVGKKGVTQLVASPLLDRFGLPGLESKEFWPMPDTITAKESTAIAETIENYFLADQVDKIEICYSRFINLISNEPAIRTLLPLSATGRPVVFSFWAKEQEWKIRRMRPSS